MSLFLIMRTLLKQLAVITVVFMSLVFTTVVLLPIPLNVSLLFLTQITVLYVVAIIYMCRNSQITASLLIQAFNNFLYFRHKDLATEQSKLLQFISDDFAQCAKVPKHVVNYVLRHTNLDAVSHFVDGLFNSPFIKISLHNDTIKLSDLLKQYTIKTDDNVELFYFTQNKDKPCNYDINVNPKALTTILAHDNKFYRDLFIRHLNGLYWEPTIPMLAPKKAAVLKLVTTNEST